MNWFWPVLILGLWTGIAIGVPIVEAYRSYKMRGLFADWTREDEDGMA